jgi:DNA-binding transcriptional LysR family regulator
VQWDDMKVFLAIASTRGLKKAADQLGVHHTSCARRIKVFEHDLGVKLFDRLPGGYTLTPAGESLYQSAQTIRQEFNAIESDLMGKDLRLEGDICLTIPNGFALNLLMPDIHAFMQRYADVNLRINMTYLMIDLANREADVAIRHVENPPDSLAGRRVALLHSCAYASTNYLSSYDPVNDPESCHWLGWGNAADHLDWTEKSNFPDIPVRGDMYSDVLQLAAIQQDMGIASLPCFMGDTTQGLQRIPGATPVPNDWIWVLAHKDMANNARVRILINFLHESFKQHSDLIEGRCERQTETRQPQS